MGLGNAAAAGDDAGINTTETGMDDFDELAGRIEGVARALLHTVAELEAAGLMDGPRLSGALRRGLPAADAPPAQLSAARTLRELAQALDDARSWRQARGRR